MYPQFFPINLNYIDHYYLKVRNLAFTSTPAQLSNQAKLYQKLKKIYLFQNNEQLLQKYLLLNRNNFKKISKLNFKFHKNILRYLQKNGYCNSIEYLNLYTKEYQYTIFRIKWNPIIRKIKISNYNQLKIPNSILFKLFDYQLGFPINYKNVYKSLNIIKKWYKVKGFKYNAIEINFSQKTQTMYINIIEGKILKIICKYNQEHVNNANLQSVIRLNYLIKQELKNNLGNTLNIYDLEINMIRLKKKYNLSNIRHTINFSNNGLKIIVIYTIILEKTILNNFQYCILIRNSQYDIYITNYLQKFVRLLNKIHIIKQINYLLNFFYIKSSINYTKMYNFHSTLLYNYFNFYSICILNKFIMLSMYNLYVKNNFLHNLFYNGQYSFSIKFKQIYYQYGFKYLRSLAILKYFSLLYLESNIKRCLLSNFLLSKPDFHLIKLSKIIQKNTILSFNIDAKSYNNFLLHDRSHKNFRLNQQFRINYQLSFHLYSNLLYCNNLLKYYKQFFYIYYNKIFQIPKIYNFNHKIKIVIENTNFNNNIKKYYINLDNLFHEYDINQLKSEVKNILQIEYQIYINKSHYIYILYNNLCKNKFLPKVLLNFNRINNLNFIQDIFKIGIQLTTPIPYMRNIRLETTININNNNKYIFNFYLKPLLDES